MSFLLRNDVSTVCLDQGLFIVSFVLVILQTNTDTTGFTNVFQRYAFQPYKKAKIISINFSFSAIVTRWGIQHKQKLVNLCRQYVYHRCLCCISHKSFQFWTIYSFTLIFRSVTCVPQNNFYSFKILGVTYSQLKVHQRKLPREGLQK